MERKEQFDYLGYTLTKCEWNRISNQFADKIRVGIDNINLNTESREFSISYKFEFIKNNDNVSMMNYQAWFKLIDENLFKSFSDLVSNPTDSLSEDISNCLLNMVHLSFPFIRQALFNMTNDLRGAINIPLTDSIQLLRGGVEFSRINSN